MITDLSQFTKKSGDRLFELGLEETSFSRPRVWLADSDDVSKQIQMTIKPKEPPEGGSTNKVSGFNCLWELN
ncbi:hypothetical protein SAMN02910293_01149 [Streptococcus henryi]|jgi:hypothetical protein|uniref:Uncharacterized protein n=1 Tax=Streptococcus henryi TaxID=439219 RepID=A0A1G6BPU6_9STRE|nr:hypothetical protein SAMN02910293_01149 [Streptococcus henryi]